MLTHLAGLAPRAAMSLATKHRGDPMAAVLPAAESRMDDIVADPAHLTAYRRLTGYRVTSYLPITYPHLASMRLGLRLMMSRPFPFTAMGMLHFGDEITELRQIPAGQRFSIRVRADNLAAHRRGVTFDLLNDATVDGETVWTQRSTFLYRVKQPPPDAAPPAAAPGESVTLSDFEALWRVPADAGRRYAEVSGDYNPIHLYPATARIYGMKRPIVHGMWSVARCVAALESRAGEAPRRLSARFRAPVSLPAKDVALCTRRADAGWEFALIAQRGQRHYLSGSMVSLGEAS